MNVIELEHPLVKHKLSILRNKETGTKKFRELVSELSTMLCYEALKDAVLGGVSLLLYGFIAVNGLKVLIKNQIDFENTRNVVISSTMLVLGLGGAILTLTSGDISISFTGMSLASIVGILLNLLLPKNSEL